VNLARALAGLAVVLFISPQLATSDEPAELFGPIERGPEATSLLRPMAARSVVVRTSATFQALLSAPNGKSARIRLPEVDFTVTLTSEPSVAEMRVVSGEEVGSGEAGAKGSIRLALADRTILAGTLVTPDLRTFQIRALPEAGSLVVGQLATSELPASLDCVVTSKQFVRRDGPPKDLGEPKDGEPFSVLVAYSKNALEEAGDKKRMDALIALAIAETNAAYKDSGIQHTLVLAGALETESESSRSLDDLLEQLREPADKHMDEIHAMRDRTSADMVCLLVSKQAEACGIGYVMVGADPGFKNRAFSVVRLNCATGYYSFGHELAHNMGCCHDPENSDGECAGGTAHGWRFPASGRVVRTIMSYQPGERIGRYSNPDLKFLGEPTGTKDANNALRINSNASVVAGWR